jgi:hypothetical protein
MLSLTRYSGGCVLTHVSENLQPQGDETRQEGCLQRRTNQLHASHQHAPEARVTLAIAALNVERAELCARLDRVLLKVAIRGVTCRVLRPCVIWFCLAQPHHFWHDGAKVVSAVRVPLREWHCRLQEGISKCLKLRIGAVGACPLPNGYKALRRDLASSIINHQHSVSVRP